MKHSTSNALLFTERSTTGDALRSMEHSTSNALCSTEERSQECRQEHYQERHQHELLSSTETAGVLSSDARACVEVPDLSSQVPSPAALLSSEAQYSSLEGPGLCVGAALHDPADELQRELAKGWEPLNGGRELYVKADEPNGLLCELYVKADEPDKLSMNNSRSTRPRACNGKDRGNGGARGKGEGSRGKGAWRSSECGYCTFRQCTGSATKLSDCIVCNIKLPVPAATSAKAMAWLENARVLVFSKGLKSMKGVKVELKLTSEEARAIYNPNATLMLSRAGSEGDDVNSFDIGDWVDTDARYKEASVCAASASGSKYAAAADADLLQNHAYLPPELCVRGLEADRGKCSTCTSSTPSREQSMAPRVASCTPVEDSSITLAIEAAVTAERAAGREREVLAVAAATATECAAALQRGASDKAKLEHEKQLAEVIDTAGAATIVMNRELSATTAKLNEERKQAEMTAEIMTRTEADNKALEISLSDVGAALTAETERLNMERDEHALQLGELSSSHELELVALRELNADELTTVYWKLADMGVRQAGLVTDVRRLTLRAESAEEATNTLTLYQEESEETIIKLLSENNELTKHNAMSFYRRVSSIRLNKPTAATFKCAWLALCNNVLLIVGHMLMLIGTCGVFVAGLVVSTFRKIMTGGNGILGIRARNIILIGLLTQGEGLPEASPLASPLAPPLTSLLAMPLALPLALPPEGLPEASPLASPLASSLASPLPSLHASSIIPPLAPPLTSPLALPLSLSKTAAVLSPFLCGVLAMSNVLRFVMHMLKKIGAHGVAAARSPPSLDKPALGAVSGISVSSKPALVPRAALCASGADVPLAKLLPCVLALDAPTQLQGAKLSQRSVRLPGTMLSRLAILSTLLLTVAPFGSPTRHGLLMQQGSLWQPVGTTQLNALPLAETLLAQLTATSSLYVCGTTGVPSLGPASFTPALSAQAPPPAQSPVSAFYVPAVWTAGKPSATSCAPSASTLASGTTKVPSHGAASPTPAISAPAVGTAGVPCAESQLDSLAVQGCSLAMLDSTARLSSFTKESAPSTFASDEYCSASFCKIPAALSSEKLSFNGILTGANTLKRQLTPDESAKLIFPSSEEGKLKRLYKNQRYSVDLTDPMSVKSHCSGGIRKLLTCSGTTAESSSPHMPEKPSSIECGWLTTIHEIGIPYNLLEPNLFDELYNLTSPT
jgi:hypothetical protein